MDRHVARLPDVFGLLPHDLGHEFTESRVADVAVQVRDLRWLQRFLDLVDTFEQVLQRVPGMEAGCPWVAVDVPLGKARALRRVRELLFQEREVCGDLHGGSEVSPEGAGLQGGEEGVEFGEVGALAGFLLFDGFDDGGEAVLEVEGRESDLHRRSLLGVDIELNCGGATCLLKEEFPPVRRDQGVEPQSITLDRVGPKTHHVGIDYGRFIKVSKE